MGVLSFIEGLKALNQQRDLAQQEMDLRRQLAEMERERALAEIEARTQGVLKEQKGAAEADVQRVAGTQNLERMGQKARENEMTSAIQMELLRSGEATDPGEALLEARSRTRQMKVNPAYDQSLTAKKNTALTLGYLPNANEVGRRQSLADAAGFRTAETGSNLNTAINQARILVAPQAAAAQDRNVEAANRRSAIENEAVPSDVSASTGMMGENAKRAKFKEDTVQGNYNATETALHDPLGAATAKNEADKAAASVARTTSALGFQVGPLQLSDPYGPFMGAQDAIPGRVRSVVQGLPPVNFTPSPMSSTALPNRTFSNPVNPAVAPEDFTEILNKLRQARQLSNPNAP